MTETEERKKAKNLLKNLGYSKNDIAIYFNGWDACEKSYKTTGIWNNDGTCKLGCHLCPACAEAHLKGFCKEVVECVMCEKVKDPMICADCLDEQFKEIFLSEKSQKELQEKLKPFIQKAFDAGKKESEESHKKEIEELTNTKFGARPWIMYGAKKGREAIIEDIKSFVEDKTNPKVKCKCGFEGREHDLKMDEAIEFYCPKCETEIEIQGCHAEIVLILNKFLEKIKGFGK